MTTRIIAGGTGFIGTALTHHWQKAGHKIIVIGRDKSKIQKRFDDSVSAVDWDEFEKSGADLLKKIDVIINLTGAGIADSRWSDKRKDEIIQSRVKSTKTISSFCATLGADAPVFLNAGGVGIYGSHSMSETFDEDSEINHPTNFLTKVSTLWEKATDKNARVIQMRFGVVLDKSGGALQRMAIPFHMFIGGVIGDGKQPVSWITLRDLIRAIDFLITQKDFTGVVNLVAPGCVKQKDFAKALGEALNRPSIIPTPGFALTMTLGQMAQELLLEGQNVRPKRLEEMGFEFEFPEIGEGLLAAKIAKR